MGRNIAEGVRKLHGTVNFLSAVGKDPASQLIRDSLERAHLYLAETTENDTCSCAVIFDQLGDCRLIISSDMEIFKNITADFVSLMEFLIDFDS